MKYIKYLAIALLFGAGLSSCEQVGTVGETTVEFADATYETSFGVGTFYLPLIITADNEADMNTADVQAKLVVDAEYQPADGVHAAKHDTTGIATDGGDYRITSLDVNFPDYPGYFDKKEPEKYFDAELGKWVKKVQVEIAILNTTDYDAMEFKLSIESATTKIGAVKDCVVTIKKAPQDLMCGEWYIYHEGSALGTGAPSPLPVTFSWNSSESAFDITDEDSWFAGMPYRLYFDTETEQITLPSKAFVGMYAGVYYTVQVVYGLTSEGNLVSPTQSEYIAQYDNESIVFPGFAEMIGLQCFKDAAMTSSAGFLEMLWVPQFNRSSTAVFAAPSVGVSEAPVRLLSEEEFAAKAMELLSK